MSIARLAVPMSIARLAVLTGVARLAGWSSRGMDVAWRRARTGSGVWLAVAIMASGLRLLVRWSKREREVVYRSELAPGEQLTIRHSRAGDNDDRSTAERA